MLVFVTLFYRLAVLKYHHLTEANIVAIHDNLCNEAKEVERIGNAFSETVKSVSRYAADVKSTGHFWLLWCKKNCYVEVKNV